MTSSVADLMPAALAFAFLDQLQLVAVPLGPARVHAKQHLGPVLAFGAAGAGMDFEIGVVAVGLARQHRFQPLLLRRAWRARRWTFSASATIAASFSASAISIRPVASASSFSSARTADMRLVELLALAHQLLRGLRDRSRWRGLRPWRSVRRGGGRTCPSQRCLLSRAMACWMSSTVRSVSGRMGFSLERRRYRRRSRIRQSVVSKGRPCLRRRRWAWHPVPRQ